MSARIAAGTIADRVGVVEAGNRRRPRLHHAHGRVLHRPAHGGLPQGILDAPIERQWRGAHEPDLVAVRILFGQNLGEMAHTHRAAATMQAAVHVHAAADVGHDDGVGAAGFDLVELSRQHRRRDVGHFHREEAAKAAADLRFIQGAQPRTGHRLKQRARLCPRVQAAQAVTTGMVGEGAPRGGADVGDAEHVHEKLRQLEGTVRQGASLVRVHPDRRPAASRTDGSPCRRTIPRARRPARRWPTARRWCGGRGLAPPRHSPS